MVAVSERPPAADGDEAQVAVLGEDHGPSIIRQRSLWPGSVTGSSGGPMANESITPPTWAPNAAAPSSPKLDLLHQLCRVWTARAPAAVAAGPRSER
jgi:hypothetical protein